MIGTTELVIILVIVVLLFGASRIPALAESVGKGVRSFRRGLRGDEIDVTPGKSTDELPPSDEEASSKGDKA